MDAAVVPVATEDTALVPNFLTEGEVRAAELDRVRQQVAAGLLGGPEHRNLEPPDVLREVYEEEESSVQSKSIRSVDRKSNPLYARDMMLDVLNEMSYPRPETFEERRVLRKLRALKSFVRGSCGDVPGATAKDVRDILVLGKSQRPAIAALTELLSRRYEAATRFAAVELIQALAVPDVDSADGRRWDSILGDGWAVSSNTERQRVLGFAPGLVEGLVRWLQSSCVRHESAANEREEAPHSLSPTKHRGTEWDRREVEVCALVLMTLRNLCVSSETAQRLGECQAIPPLLTCLRFGPLELTQPAVACLVPIAIWHPRLVGLHGGVAPLVGMLRVPKLPLARAAAIRILGQVAPDIDDCTEIVDHGGCDLLAAIAFDGIGGRKRKPGLPSTVAHAQIGALWTLARIATHGEHVDCLRDDRIRKAILRSLEPEQDQVGCEAALMLLRKLGECSPFDEGDPWSSKLALDAAPLAAACAHSSRPEPVRAQAACCFEQLYISDHARHRLVFGRDVRDVEMTSETDFGPTDYLEVVYGKESAEASKARALKKAADLGQLSVLDSLKEEEEDAEAEKLAEEKRRLRTAPPPSTRVRVFDRDECEALRDAPVTKGKVSLLEAAGAPRLIKIDSGIVRWETRAKATGFVATCTAHNEYEEEFREMRANPQLMEAMRAEARANKSLFSRYKDPCQRKQLRDGLPEGPVDIPEAYDEIECSDILECRRVSLAEIERHGVPETADCDPAGFFLVRTATDSILMECIPDRPAFGPMPSTKSDKEALARDVSRDWILRLLGLLEDHYEALGKKFDLKAFDEDAWAMREQRRKDHASGKKRRGSLSSIKDDPNEMNPRRWEALVERACGGHDDDMLHEMALAEQKGLAKPSPYRNAPTRRRKHPDVLKELWSMALHPTSVSLVQRGCLALLSLCSEPGVNAHVREHWKREFNALPESLSTGVASRSKVLVTKKLELLVLLNQLEIVEKNVWRVARPLRLKFQAIILNWRKHLGYSALSSATAGFDKETLLKLQELFAELDADGADSASKVNLNFMLKRRRRARELSSPPRHRRGAFVASRRARAVSRRFSTQVPGTSTRRSSASSSRTCACPWASGSWMILSMKLMLMATVSYSVLDAVDARVTHHTGEIDFEEFLLVIKNMQNPGAVQSKLGVAVQKGVKKGVFQTTMRGGAKALFEGVAGAAKEIPGARRQNLRHAVDDNRREKLREEIKEIDKDVLRYQAVDPKRRMRRAHLNASWSAACRQTYDLAKDWGDGVCACEPLLHTLVANPELVEKLGFCTKPKGWAQDTALYKQYQSMLDIAASYGTLSRAATDAGLAFDDNDEGTIQSGEFDDQDWSYREFEEAVVRLVRACRGEVAREQAERERYAANAERVSKKKVKPKKGLFGALVARGVD